MTIDWTKPIQTRDGRSARLLCKDLKGARGYPVVVALLDERGYESLEHYTLGGQYLTGDDEENDHDLINLPERVERWFGVDHCVLVCLDAHPEDGQSRAWGFEDEDAARTLAPHAEAYLCITFEGWLPVSSKIVKK